MRKKLFATVLISGSLLALSACAKPPEEAVVPTTAPTSTAVPTSTTAPTVTMAVQETLTPTPEAEPTVESTTEPTATAAPEPTSTPTPTEVPHEHIWTEKETAPTCTADGLYWEECDCGAIQNETKLPSMGHGETTYQIVADPTVDKEGAYEITCNICQMVIESGVLPKLTPTPAPTATPEPTATSTPVPTEEPTAAPTETPVPTATVTPTPKPTAAPVATAVPTETPVHTSPKPTSTPKPTKKPEPTATPGPTRIPVEEYTWWDVNHELIRYADESCTEVIKTYYDLNLVEEGVTLYNYSDEKLGEQIEVMVRDYPADDAKVVYTIPTYMAGTIRGQVIAVERCVETGWYRVIYGKDKNGKDKIGYVDDEYVKAGTSIGFTADGHHYPALEYCQFEMPYLGSTHKLAQPEDLTLAVGKSKKYIIKAESLNLFYQIYYPNLRIENETARTVGVFSVENLVVAEIDPNKPYSDYYKADFGYYDINGAYGANFIAKSPGTTLVTLTEYEISDYQYNDGEPTFVLGDIINTVTFNITVTE